MSPLLRDELQIVLAPSQVSMARSAMALTRRGVRRRVLAQASAACPAAAPGEPAWSGALQVLDQQLRGMSGLRANLRVILSSQFVRYAIVPSQPDLKPDEDAGYLRHYFAQMFGCSADGWDICAGAAPDGAPRLASAIDSALLLALRQLCALDAIRLTAVVPQFASTFDRHRHGLPARGWLVEAEPGCLCIGLFEDRRWLSVRTLRTGAAWLQDLPALLARETSLANPAGEVGDVFLSTPDRGVGTVFPQGRFRFHVLAQQDMAGPGEGR